MKKILHIIFLLIFCYSFMIAPKYKKIEVDINLGKLNGGGPVEFVKGIMKVLPYKNKGCLFIPSEYISFINGKNNSDYFYISYPYFNENVLREWKSINRSHYLLLGPNLIPIKWDAFPIQASWNEKNWKEILKNIKGYVVHSKRVRNHLSERSNTEDMLNKYIIVRACTYIMPKHIKPFVDRVIDILFFEKFADSNRRKQAKELVKLFNNEGKKLLILSYGNYTKNQMLEISNDSKFIIYFSFYDSGAIALKEIQNFGVFAFTLQKDLAIHKKTSLYIPELENIDNMKPAFNIIMKKMKIISDSKPNTEIMARINQDINKCERALDDICKGI